MILDKDNMFFNILQVYIKFYKKGNFFSMLVFINVRDRKWRTKSMSIAWTANQAMRMDFTNAALFGGASTINNLPCLYPPMYSGFCNGLFGYGYGGGIYNSLPRTLEAYDKYSAVNLYNDMSFGDLLKYQLKSNPMATLGMGISLAGALLPMVPVGMNLAGGLLNSLAQFGQQRC